MIVRPRCVILYRDAVLGSIGRVSRAFSMQLFEDRPAPFANGNVTFPSAIASRNMS